MYYLHVLVASNAYHGNEALTYSSRQPLKRGAIVVVPLRKAKVSGIVITQSTTKPHFAVKEIIGIQVSRQLPQASLRLIEWMRVYYPANISTITSQFIPNNLLLSERNEITTSTEQIAAPRLPPLTKDQSLAIKAISESSQRSFLVHGDTGTGKTRVYIELIKSTLAAQQSCLILTPEIGLTPQLRQSLRGHGADVYILHSGLSATERRRIWLQILYTTKPLIIAGPRSALFAPLSSIGLIVIDEAHDSAYKQDQSPHYNAIRVAGKLADIHNAKLVLGTATPPVSEYFVMEHKHLPILRLQQIAAGSASKPSIDIINARDRSNYIRNPYISDQLITAINRSLESHEQSLVFLNRRGTARLVMCQDCDWHALCPKCDLPLTYHGDTHSMRCHTCGYRAVALTTCPTCHSSEIVFKSLGTKAIAAALQIIFPHAVIKRFDTDNTKDESFEQHYNEVVNGTIDILVGTQMLVKGLDLPKLSTVGVAAADTSLYFPDYTSEEQTYQLLTQVIGRVARGHRTGSVVIQTFNPNSSALNTIMNRDWELFYKQQLFERRQFLFPPYCYLLKLTCSRNSQSAALKASTKLVNELLAMRFKVEIIGPTPRFNERANAKYNWQIIIKAKNRTQLTAIIPHIPAKWNYDLDPISLL